MAEETDTGGVRDTPRSLESAAVDPRAVRETFRGILLEIPGFRALAERGISPSLAGGSPTGSAEASEGATAPVASASPAPETSEGDSRLSCLLNSPSYGMTRGSRRAPLTKANSWWEGRTWGGGQVRSKLGTVMLLAR